MRLHRAFAAPVVALVLSAALGPDARAAATADTAWTANGVPVVSDAFFIQRAPFMTADGAGGALVGWKDLRGGVDYDLYLARLDGTGQRVAGWPVSGAAVCSAAGEQTQPAIASDAAGGAFIAWSDPRDGVPDIYLQHVLASGAIGPGWPAGGLAVCNAPGDQFAPSVVPDGAGGAIVAWADYRAGSVVKVYLVRFDSRGDLLPGWPINGRAASSASGDQTDPVLIPDGGSGVIVAWRDFRDGGAGAEADLYAQHLTGAGTIAAGWLATGVPLCTSAGDQNHLALAADGASGAVAAWLDARAVSPGTYAVRVTDAGALYPGWIADGVPLSTAVVGDARPVAVADGSGGALVVWSDLRGGGADIYAQHVQGGGTIAAGWPASGAALCNAAGEQLEPVAVADGGGGAIVAWTDARGAGADIYAQHVTGAGGIVPGWPVSGVAICTATGDQSVPVVASDGAAGAIVAWQDQRAGNAGDIYAARVTSNGVVAALASLVSADATRERVRLRWNVASGAPVTIERCKPGSAWGAIARALPDGSGMVAYEDRDVTPGARYGYRLAIASGGAAAHAGEVWVAVPDGAAGFALAGARPNPASDALVVWFTLPDDGAPTGAPTEGGSGSATLELFDLAGRRLAAREVGSLGAGSHALALGASQLGAGVYVVRLTRAGQVLTARACVLR